MLLLAVLTAHAFFSNITSFVAYQPLSDIYTLFILPTFAVVLVIIVILFGISAHRKRRPALDFLIASMVCISLLLAAYTAGPRFVAAPFVIFCTQPVQHTATYSGRQDFNDWLAFKFSLSQLQGIEAVIRESRGSKMATQLLSLRTGQRVMLIGRDCRYGAIIDEVGPA